MPNPSCRYVVCLVPLLLCLVSGDSPQLAQALPPKSKAAAGRTDEETQLKNVESKANQCKDARSAVELYTAFLARMDLTPQQKETASNRAQHWQRMADQGMIRLGFKWMTQEEANAIGAEADKLIEDAAVQAELKEYGEARKLLQKASNIDPDGIRADFILGMLNTPGIANHPPTAEKHFSVALRRQPTHLSVLNNLALSEVRTGQFGDAVEHWATALGLAPGTPEIIQNLGRFVEQSKAKKLRPQETVINKATKLYINSITTTKRKANPQTGWLYMPLYLSSDEKLRTKVKTNGEKVNTGSASGFVAHAQFIVTNRHVAEAGDAFRIVDPADSKLEYEATLVASDRDLDVAVLSCPKLTAPAVALAAELPRRGSDMMLLGYPQSDTLGSSLKSTRGVIAGFLGADEQIVLYDAVTNAGNSGGPVCDQTGNVIAIHALGLGSAALGPNSGKFGGGIPIATAFPFLKKQIPELGTATGGSKLDWPDIDAKISPSTVLIRIYSAGIATGLPMSRDARLSNLEDRSCDVCKGTGKVPCPIKGCVKGKVSKRESRMVTAGAGTTARVETRIVTVTVNCSKCGGEGSVSCTDCLGTGRGQF
jgi:S1-C subfamily serine protease